VGNNFEFDSMESDDVGLIWFRRLGEGYRIGSLYQEFPAMAMLQNDQVRRIIAEFVDELQRRSLKELQIDLAWVLAA
jgi:hypothetical protein